MRPDPEVAAAVFDLDGVVTLTARVHASAWKQLFDDYLRVVGARNQEPFRPFDIDADYRAYIDGRPRYDGVRTFLASRGIHLPDGSPADPPDRETICGLGNRKNDLFRKKIREMGVDVDWDAVRFIRELRAHNIRVGVASSSKNTTEILHSAGLADLFEAQVDGIISEQIGLKGKPSPDIFLRCLEMLGSKDPGRAVVFEDAVAGVEAGRAGRFGLVVGVDRDEASAELREHGADWVIRSFKEISLDRMLEHFRAKAA